MALCDVKFRVASKNKNGNPTQRKNRKKNSRQYVVPIRAYNQLVKCDAMGSMAPDFIRVTLPFQQINGTGLIGGIGSTFQYRGNSCFDPDFTGFGTDCNLFSEWARIYAKYRVRGSKCTVRVVPETVTAGQVVNVGLTAYSGTTAISVLTGITDVVASNFGKGKLINAYNSPATLITQLESTDVLGAIPVAFKIDDGYAAAINANPVKEWMWQISAYCGVNCTIDLTVLIQYDVEFFERIQTTA